MNEKNLGIMGTLGCILLGVIACLIAWFCGGNKLQTPTREVIRKMFNIELTLTIIGVIFMFIPALSRIVCPCLNIISVVLAVMAFMAIKNNTEFNVPSIEFIK